jgi:hypothetical protein
MSVEPTTPDDGQATLADSITDDVAAGDLDQTGSLDGPAVETDDSGRVFLRWCPACGVPFSSHDHRETHVARHDPADFGLAPVGEGRRRTTAAIFGDQTPVWEGQR